MSALHKLRLIGLKESKADKEKGRDEEREEKGKRCVVTAKIWRKKKSAGLYFLN